MKDEYPDVKQDLYGAFVVRGIELADPRGLLAIVIGDTWMSIKSFEAMRLRLLNGHAFDSFVHLRDVSNHPDIFGANAAFVLALAGARSQRAPFIRLTRLGSERKEQDLRVALLERTMDTGYHLASGEDFAAIPGSPIVYWLSEKMRGAFKTGTPLGDIADLNQGLITADNDRFLRQWWEVAENRTGLSCSGRAQAVEAHRRWFPFNKGGDFRRWYGNQEYVVNWEDDGTQIRAFGTEGGGRARSRPQNVDYYFQPTVSWSDISSGAPSFRRFPFGFIHGNKGNSAFGSRPVLDRVLGMMNAPCATIILEALTPTMTASVGDVAKTPMPEPSAELSTATIEALVSTAQRDWDESETSWNFGSSPLVAVAQKP